MKRLLGLMVAGGLWLGMASAAEAQFSLSIGPGAYGWGNPYGGFYGGALGVPYGGFGLPGTTVYSSGSAGVLPGVTTYSSGFYGVGAYPGVGVGVVPYAYPYGVYGYGPVGFRRFGGWGFRRFGGIW